MADGSIGAYTTAELLGWFQGVMPSDRAKKDTVGTDIPVMGKVREEFMEKEYGRAYDVEGEVSSSRRGVAARPPDSDDEDGGDVFNYEPRYNLHPEEDQSFLLEDEEDFGPGKPINPNAKPGDNDYAVDESLSAVYDDFSFTEDKNPHLPVHDNRVEILDTIRNHKVSWMTIRQTLEEKRNFDCPNFFVVVKVVKLYWFLFCGRGMQ